MTWMPMCCLFMLLKAIFRIGLMITLVTWKFVYYIYVVFKVGFLCGPEVTLVTLVTLGFMHCFFVFFQFTVILESFLLLFVTLDLCIFSS